MTPKELLYLADALDHEKELECITNHVAQSVSEADLQPFLTQLATKHKEIFNQFFHALE